MYIIIIYTCRSASYPNRVPNARPVHTRLRCHAPENGLHTHTHTHTKGAGACVCLPVAKVVKSEVAEDGEVREKDDKGIQHDHTALNDERII